MFKDLVQQIDVIVTQGLPLPQPVEPGLQPWAAVHGWDITDAAAQRLLLRQALLNAILRRGVPDLNEHAFATPLDGLNADVPSALVDQVCQGILRAAPMVFNPWGAFYNALNRPLYRL